MKEKNVFLSVWLVDLKFQPCINPLVQGACVRACVHVCIYVAESAKCWICTRPCTKTKQNKAKPMNDIFVCKNYSIKIYVCRTKCWPSTHSTSHLMPHTHPHASQQLVTNKAVSVDIDFIFRSVSKSAHNIWITAGFRNAFGVCINAMPMPNRCPGYKSDDRRARN